MLESLSLWHDALLNSISAEEVDIYDTFKLPSDIFSDKLSDLDSLSDNVEFIKITQNGLIESKPHMSKWMDAILKRISGHSIFG